jgi:hypothetical protein
MLVSDPLRRRSTAKQRRSQLSMFRIFVPPEYSTRSAAHDCVQLELQQRITGPVIKPRGSFLGGLGSHYNSGQIVRISAST